MRDEMIKIERIDSGRELESIISIENIITLDQTQNTYYKINIYEEFTIGIKYCSHGIDIDCKFVANDKLLFIGVGMHLLCIDTQKKKILFIKELKSVFFEILTNFNHDYLCVLCELNLYCYAMEKMVGEIDFREIITVFNKRDNDTICVSCENGEEFIISVMDGKLI